MSDLVRLLLFLALAIAVSYGAMRLFIWSLTRHHPVPHRISSACANCDPGTGRRPGHLYRSRNAGNPEESAGIVWMPANEYLRAVVAGETCSTSTL